MTTRERRDKADWTVAVCRCGGAVIECVTDHMSLEVVRQLSIAAAYGYDIKRMAKKDARKLPFGCKCVAIQANKAGIGKATSKGEMTWTRQNNKT